MIYVIQDGDGEVKCVATKDPDTGADGRIDMNAYAIKCCIDGERFKGVVHWPYVFENLHRNGFHVNKFEACKLMRSPLAVSPDPERG